MFDSMKVSKLGTYTTPTKNKTKHLKETKQLKVGA